MIIQSKTTGQDYPVTGIMNQYDNSRYLDSISPQTFGPVLLAFQPQKLTQSIICQVNFPGFIHPESDNSCTGRKKDPGWLVSSV
jgi:hypothetical protein